MRRAKREPARKFTDRKFGNRIGWVIQGRATTHNFSEKTRGLFKAAEAFVGSAKSQPGTYIFLGGGMRPLFESIRAINEQDKAHRRSTFRYVVTPHIIYPGIPAERARVLKDKLVEKRIASQKQNRYFIVDMTTSQEWQTRAVAEAIRSINPKAEVSTINQDHPIFGEGVAIAERMPRPTSKDKFGNILTHGKGIKQAQYIAVEHALQQYLKERASRTPHTSTNSALM